MEKRRAPSTELQCIPEALTEPTMLVLKAKTGITPFRTQWTPLQLVGFCLF